MSQRSVTEMQSGSFLYGLSCSDSENEQAYLFCECFVFLTLEYLPRI